jgi:hypothetical protein
MKQNFGESMQLYAQRRLLEMNDQQGRKIFYIGGGGKKFQPNQVANLAAWFRLGVGITETGQGVSQWDDQSGNGRHLKQGTDGARPSKQSDGSILFNGSDEFLKCDAFTFSQPTCEHPRKRSHPVFRSS